MAIIFCFYLIKDTISFFFFKKNSEIHYFSKIIEEAYVLLIQKVNLLKDQLPERLK